MRSERWTTKEEIQEALVADGSGPVLFHENGISFTHDGEGHVMLMGMSGSGKSRRGTIPLAQCLIRHGESAVFVDPKGEIYASTKGMIGEDYDVHVIDFRSLYDENGEGWNPLFTPYSLWKSGEPKDRHMAEQMIEELTHTMYPEVKGGDPFWIQEARNVFLGAVWALFEVAKEDEINLASVYYFIAKGDEQIGSVTYLKMLLAHSDSENVIMQLQSYVSTAEATRGGIRSVFFDGLSVATKSVSVREFLARNDLRIHELSGDKPTLIYIIIPDETPVYSSLTGVLVSQLLTHYVRIAEQRYNGKLPIRMNVLLEELGNIGRSIPNLPHIMSAGRSRNIRVEFVVQSISQLVDLYGESLSTTIVSNCDIRVAFRLCHWDTLSELSRFCGEREVDCGDHVSTEPLITPPQLAAMKTGQALVLISGRLKYIAFLPDYTEVRIAGPWKVDIGESIKISRQKPSYFDIQNYVWGLGGFKNIGQYLSHGCRATRSRKSQHNHIVPSRAAEERTVDSEGCSRSETDDVPCELFIIDLGINVNQAVDIIKEYSSLSKEELIHDTKDIGVCCISMPDKKTAREVERRLDEIGAEAFVSNIPADYF